MIIGNANRGRSMVPLKMLGVLATLSTPVLGQVVVKDHVTDSSVWSASARISNWEYDGALNEPDFIAACAFTGNGGTLKTVEGIFWNVDSLNAPNGAIWANIDFQIIFFDSTGAFLADPVNGTSKFLFGTPDNIDWMTPIASFNDPNDGLDYDLHRFSIDVESLGITTVKNQTQLVALTPIGNPFVDGETGMMFSTGGGASVGTEPDWWAQLALSPIGPDALPDIPFSPHDHLAYRLELGPDPCPVDLNGSGSGDIADLLNILANWGPCPAPCPQDLVENGVVDISDLLLLLANWGPCD
jgi:hypothetical protein